MHLLYSVCVFSQTVSAIILMVDHSVFLESEWKRSAKSGWQVSKLRILVHHSVRQFPSRVNESIRASLDFITCTDLQQADTVRLRVWSRCQCRKWLSDNSLTWSSSITADGSDQQRFERALHMRARVCKQMEELVCMWERGVPGDRSEECTSDRISASKTEQKRGRWVACTWHLVKLFTESLA